MGLSLTEIKRYSRQLILPDFGSREQNRLKAAKVLITGAGGIGCPAAINLALAGVGQIDIVDKDDVELTNLNRQFLFTPEDVGKPKAARAAEVLRKLNPEIEVNGIQKDITYENAFDFIKDYDAVVDGTDNFPVRYAINDACMKNKIPLFHSAVLMYESRVTSIIPGESACFRCIFPEAPPAGLVPSCREGGVIAPTIGVAAAIQSMECIRYLAGLPISLKNKLLIINVDTSDFTKLNIKRNESCTACGPEFVPKPVAEVCVDKLAVDTSNVEDELR